MKKMFIALLLVPMLHAEPVSFYCVENDSKVEIILMVDSDNKYMTFDADYHDVYFRFSTNWKETDTTVVAIDDDEGILELKFNKYSGNLYLNFLTNTMKYEYRCKKAKSLLLD